MPVEPRRPTVDIPLTTRGGQDEMIKTSIELQDLRKRIYVKAKAERFWLEEVE
jgi:hypothetical protein